MKKSRIFKCHDRNLLIEVLGGDEEGVKIEYCGQEMIEMIPNTVDASKEKHVPVFECRGYGMKVKVGEVEHPMTKEHHIEWIEVLKGAYTNRKYLKWNGKPEAEFDISLEPGIILRIYCNLHGLWENHI